MICISSYKLQYIFVTLNLPAQPLILTSALFQSKKYLCLYRIFKNLIASQQDCYRSTLFVVKLSMQFASSFFHSTSLSL